MDGVRVRQLSSSDIDVVENFLKEEYYTREPVRSHLGILPDDNWMREKSVVQRCLEAEMSYGAFDKSDGFICAVCLNIVGTNAGSFNYGDSYPLCLKQFIQLLKADGMDEYVTTGGTKKYMELYILCVKDSYGKRGLATHLCEMSLERAKQSEFEFVVIGCLSAYSRKIAERLGFKVIREVVYKDYVDPHTQEMVMKDISKPHYASTFLLMELL